MSETGWTEESETDPDFVPERFRYDPKFAELVRRIQWLEVQMQAAVEDIRGLHIGRQGRP